MSAVRYCVCVRETFSKCGRFKYVVVVAIFNECQNSKLLPFLTDSINIGNGGTEKPRRDLLSQRTHASSVR